MQLLKARTIILATLLCALFASSGMAADDAILARDIMTKNRDAVVNVRLVIKMQMSMQGQASPKQEMKVEINGTVIDPSGLTVMSLSESSPEELMSRMGYGEDQGISVTAETTDVKIRMANGTEVPAKVVLRDKDLDLAFVRPAQKLATPAPFIDLAASSKPSVLDPVVMLGRLGKVASRVCCAKLDHIQAIIEKPRTLYVPCADGQSSSLGVPVFCLDGKIAGLMVLRMMPMGSDSGAGSFMQGGSDSFIAVTLPAEDVLEIAKQAPEQAAPEKKPAAEPAAKPAAPAPAKAPAKTPAKPAPKPAK